MAEIKSSIIIFFNYIENNFLLFFDCETVGTRNFLVFKGWNVLCFQDYIGEKDTFEQVQ